MYDQSPTINIFEKVARKAGKFLIRDFGEIENLQIQSKGVADFVTNIDLKVEKILIESLQNYYPNSSFLSEEKGRIKGNNETIVIDPIDGTTNFIHGIPQVGIVISKIVEDEIIDGVIFNPIMNDFFWASKGRGAWHNNRRMRVSKRKNLDTCLIGAGIAHNEIKNERDLMEIQKISKYCAGIRRMGSAAIDLAYVAAGKLDAFWERNLNLWDVSSGVLIVREAGGKITEPNGNTWELDSQDILASNSLIHEEIIEKLK